MRTPIGVDWEPRDPRLDRLFDDLDASQIEHEGDLSQPGLKLLDSLIAETSPAWQRILNVLPQRAEHRRTTAPHS